MTNTFAVTLTFGGHRPINLELQANTKASAEYKALATLTGIYRQDLEKVTIKKIKA